MAIVLGAVVFAVVRNFTTSYEHLAANELSAEARSFQSEANARPRTEPLRSFTISYLRQRALPAGDVALVELVGLGRIETLGGTSFARLPDVAAMLTAPPKSTTIRTLGGTGRPLELLVAPIRESGRTIGSFIVVADLSAFSSERSRIIDVSIGGALVALFVGVVSTFLLLRRMLRTVGRVTETAEAIGSGRLDSRLGEENRPDEVGELACTFDAMLERIETAMNAQRRLLADVSHQLRTPLTVVRGHLEVLQRTGTGDRRAVEETNALVIDELERMRLLVERLLLLGRAMDPDFLSPELIYVPSFLGDIHDAAVVLGARRYVLAPPPNVLVEADLGKLRGALLNIVDNAVRATHDDDVIGIGAQVDEDGIEFIVEDSGPGIPEAEREAALRRFARPGARDEDGSGLGLAIAKSVAEAHGGHVAIGESLLGGASVAIVLPSCRLVAQAG